MIKVTGINENKTLIRFKQYTYPENEYEVALADMSKSSRDLYGDYYISAVRVKDLLESDSSFCKVRLLEEEYNTLLMMNFALNAEVSVPFVARVESDVYETAYRIGHTEVQCRIKIGRDRLRDVLTNCMTKVVGSYFVRAFKDGSVFIQNQDKELWVPQFMYIPQKSIYSFIEVKVGEAITEEGDKLSL